MPQGFRVGYSGVVQQELKRLLEEAAEYDSKFGRDAIAAVKRIDQRLRANARAFGEETFNLPNLRLQIRVAVIVPLSVGFAVHEEQDVVFVTRFRLLEPPEGQDT